MTAPDLTIRIKQVGATPPPACPELPCLRQRPGVLYYVEIVANREALHNTRHGFEAASVMLFQVATIATLGHAENRLLPPADVPACLTGLAGLLTCALPPTE